MFKLCFLMVLWLLSAPLWTPVLAQPITVDASAPGPQPVVGVSNGVPVVDIAPPGAGGVSNNAFTHFNVGPAGVVLNNSATSTQTQLAGQVNGNPALGPQPAITILNQVTAPNPSQLLGALEVAGQRANVIVANPAGISCNGCGFLNANRATLTTGRPQVGPDGRINFDVASGTILIDGAGLNPGPNHRSTLGQVDLLARALRINAGIWADRLNVVTGVNQVDYGSEQVTAKRSNGDKPAFALDTAALGSMYANSIRLIGTEAGVGVNLGGHLEALTGEIKVSAAGEVRIVRSAALKAAGNLEISAAAGLNNSGKLLAGAGAGSQVPIEGQGSIKLEAGERTPIFNVGALAAGKDATLIARSVELHGGSLSAVGRLALNTVAEDGSLKIYSTHVSGGTVDVQAADFDLRAGQLSAGRDLTISVRKKLSHEGGKLTVGADLTATVGEELNHRQGTLTVGGTARLSAKKLVNAGGVMTAQNMVINLSGELLNSGHGLIRTAGTLTINAEVIQNRDAPFNPPHSFGLAGKTIALNGGKLVNNIGGTVAAAETLTIRSSTLENGGGVLSSSRSADIHAEALHNAVAGAYYYYPPQPGRNVSGRIWAGDRLSVNTLHLTDAGTLQSEGDLFLRIEHEPPSGSSGLASRGLLGSANQWRLLNHSKISAGRDLTVHAAALATQERD